MRLTRVLLALVVFGAAFGYVEAAVVVYLREILGPAREAVLADVPHDEVFPLLTLAQLQAGGAGAVRALLTEMGRELATLAILTAVAALTARSLKDCLAGFMLAFGVWDIFYYLFLRLLLGWPESLWTWDLLFLWPTVWAGPVIAPLLVAVSMIAAGVTILWRQSRDRPVRFTRFDGKLILCGAGIIIAAFCWDSRNTSAGGWPNPFHWPLFVLGMALGAAGFLHALWARPAADDRRAVGR
jgi:hypothetical protein